MRHGHVALLILVVSVPLSAQEFRVELFSREPAGEIFLRAGQAPVGVCSIPGKRRCVELMPGVAARCSSSDKTVRCRAAELTAHGARISATSPLPFFIEAVPTGAGPGAAHRRLLVQAVEARSAGSGVRGIASVELETYVAGVLAGEGATFRSRSALQALAVVARTWALRSKGRHRAAGFDFCPLTHCQAFRLPSQSTGQQLSAFAEAAERTQGMVLKYRGELADVYYSAHCGGVTEAAGDVWPDRRAPYLPSVADPYCRRDPHFSWRRTLRLQAVEAIVREKLGVPLAGPLRGLRVARKNASGRAHILTVEGGSTQGIDANAFRYAVNRQLGWNTLKSNLYAVEQRGDSLVFTGRGLGHGVGLCQGGAEQMGEMGIAYQRILAHYFPGTTVGPLQAPSGHQILSSEHFELAFPFSQKRWAGETLQALETFRRGLEARMPLPAVMIRVRTWETTEEFIRAAGQPGWVAASNNGETIELQPLSKLAGKGILRSTLRHELTHLAVHRLRAPEVPRWYEEGLVLYLTGEQTGVAAGSLIYGRSLEESVSRPRSETEMKTAYTRALELLRDLARRRGEKTLWEVLQHPSAEDLRWLKNRR